jgi:predicted esterase YcpF (UPF0227 family)
MSATIIYLHEFAGVGNCVKSQILRTTFSNCTVHSPNLPIDPAEIIAVVLIMVQEATQFPVIFVGAGIGGFWANYFAQTFNVPCLLINPSTEPAAIMLPYVGTEIKNHSTNLPIIITHEHVAHYDELQEQASELHNGALVHLLLAMDDELIDYRSTLINLPYFKSVVVTEHGGHRYDAHWTLIINRIKDLMSPK